MVALPHTWGKGRIEMAMEGVEKKKKKPMGRLPRANQRRFIPLYKARGNIASGSFCHFISGALPPNQPTYKEKINDLLDLKRCKETGNYCRSSSTESLLSTQQSLISCCFQVRARHLLNENKRFL